MNLPAGLIDTRVEIFNDPKNAERSYILHNGRVDPVNDAPCDIIKLIDTDMANNPVKIQALRALGYNGQPALREKYCSCMFGSFDKQPDIVDGELVKNEYWHCPKRGSCPANGIACNAFELYPGQALTPRQIEVTMLTAHGKSDKEIANELGIHYETVKIHSRHIRQKLGVPGRTDIVRIAHQKNLVS